MSDKTVLEEAIADAADWKHIAKALERELLEQARLVGMGAERELALRAKVEQVERERDEALRERHTNEEMLGTANRANIDLANKNQELRASLAVAVEALEKCRAHVEIDDPNWNNLAALAFASRCVLVDMECKTALSSLPEQAKLLLRVVEAAKGVREWMGWMTGFSYHKKFPAFCKALDDLAALDGKVCK